MLTEVQKIHDSKKALLYVSADHPINPFLLTVTPNYSC